MRRFCGFWREELQKPKNPPKESAGAKKAAKEKTFWLKARGLRCGESRIFLRLGVQRATESASAARSPCRLTVWGSWSSSPLCVSLPPSADPRSKFYLTDKGQERVKGSAVLPEGDAQTIKSCDTPGGQVSVTPPADTPPADGVGANGEPTPLLEKESYCEPPATNDSRVTPGGQVSVAPDDTDGAHGEPTSLLEEVLGSNWEIDCEPPATNDSRVTTRTSVHERLGMRKGDRVCSRVGIAFREGSLPNIAVGDEGIVQQQRDQIITVDFGSKGIVNCLLSNLGPAVDAPSPQAVTAHGDLGSASSAAEEFQVVKR